MANVSVPVLDIDVVNVGASLKANVTVEYDITFSSYDRNSNQPYSVVCELMGEDAGDVFTAIPNGQLGDAVTVASGGQTTLHRKHTKRLNLSNLDEDNGVADDEIRAQVTLTPFPPRTRVERSDQFVINVP